MSKKSDPVLNDQAILTGKPDTDQGSALDVRRSNFAIVRTVCVPGCDDPLEFRKAHGRIWKISEVEALLDYLKIPCCWILHTPENDNVKWSHMHIVFSFSGSLSVRSFLDRVAPIGCKFCKALDSKRGYLTYMIHAGMLDKHPYSIEDLQTKYGFSMPVIYETTDYASSVIEWITGNEIQSVTELYSTVSLLKDQDLQRWVLGHWQLCRTICAEVRESLEK